MNMNADHPDFEALQRLLKLKRYENPPPRYFNDFSGQIINRIRATRLGQRQDALDYVSPAWLQRILSAFRESPIMAGACAAGFLALLAGGAVYTEKLESRPAALGLGGLEAQAMMPSMPVLGNVSPLASAGTNSESSLAGSALFDIGLKTQPVGWRPSGR